jgi:hypothetical protein
LNIALAAEIDPWPRYGLVAKYKPFILNRIKPFLENSRHLNRNEVIIDVIRITWAGQSEVQARARLRFLDLLTAFAAKPAIRLLRNRKIEDG